MKLNKKELAKYGALVILAWRTGDLMGTGICVHLDSNPNKIWKMIGLGLDLAALSLVTKELSEFGANIMLKALFGEEPAKMFDSNKE